MMLPEYSSWAVFTKETNHHLGGGAATTLNDALREGLRVVKKSVTKWLERGTTTNWQFAFTIIVDRVLFPLIVTAKNGKLKFRFNDPKVDRDFRAWKKTTPRHLPLNELPWKKRLKESLWNMFSKSGDMSFWEWCFKKGVCECGHTDALHEMGALRACDQCPCKAFFPMTVEQVASLDFQEQDEQIAGLMREIPGSVNQQKKLLLARDGVIYSKLINAPFDWEGPAAPILAALAHVLVAQGKPEWALADRVYGPALISQTKGEAIFCNHANEHPAECPCGAKCYCRTNTCQSMHVFRTRIPPTDYPRPPLPFGGKMPFQLK